MLDNGKSEALVAEIRSSLPSTPESAAEIESQANYFERNTARMRYPQFRRQGLTIRGANAIVALRCCRINRRFEDYWATRSTAA